MKNKGNRLAIRMLIAMIAGIVVGLGFMLLRDYLNLNDKMDVWATINNLLFQDITVAEGKNAVGLFYICGQLFVKALQLVIVPMVFTSIIMAIGTIRDAATLGRVSTKTFCWFLLTTIIALVLAGAVALICFNAGLFNAEVPTPDKAPDTATGNNPLNVLLGIVPNNMAASFTVNNAVLSLIFLAIVIGLSLNKLGYGPECTINKLCKELSEIVVTFLNFVVNHFAPIAVFMLLCRTFATYGANQLWPAVNYVVVTVLLLLIYLFVGYPIYIAVVTKMNPFIFIRKIFKVIVFGFSTSSSAATLPLNTETNVKELGVDRQVASFVLPLGMTINMDGTAIMQVVATLFLAGVGGYTVTIPNLLLIMVLALIASVGTPAAPGAGAIILFTILSGLGFDNELVLNGYALILAINRPIEMLVTSLNCVGDSVAAIAVARSEGKLNEEIYNG